MISKNSNSNVIVSVLVGSMLLIATPVFSCGGGSSSFEKKMSKASNQQSRKAENGVTMLSWLLTLTNSPNPVGPASDALAIGNSFANGAESFSRGSPKFKEAFEFALSLNDGVVKSEDELNVVKRATREYMGQQHLSDFGLSRATVDKAVEAEVEARGLKRY